MTSLNQILIFRSAAQTLKERFPDGLKLGSSEVDRFIKFFGEKYHNSAFLKTLDDAKTERLLRKVGVVLDGKVYADYPSWINNVVLSPDTTRYISGVIVKFFPDGLNIESTAQLERFWDAAVEAREKNRESGDKFLAEYIRIKKNSGLRANVDQIVLNRMIERVAPPFKGVVYPISRATLQFIEAEILRLFSDGFKLAYYSVFFERNKELPTFQKFVSPEHFQFWVSKVNSQLIRKRLYFERVKNDVSDEEKIREEIERVLPLERNKTGEELILALVERLYIPEEKIREAFALEPRLQRILDGEEEREDEASRTSTNSLDLRSALLQTLKEKYPNGFPRNSPLEKKRLRKYTREIFEKVDEYTDDRILLILRQDGCLFEDKFYMTSEADETIRQAINKEFDSGVNIVYFEPFFQKLRSQLPDFFSVELLKSRVKLQAQLKNICKTSPESEYCERRRFVGFQLNSSTPLSEDDKVAKEIKRVWGDGTVVSSSELFERLPLIPVEKIKSALRNKLDFVRNIEKTYALLDQITITIDDDARSQAIDYITREVQLNEFASLDNMPVGNMSLRNEEVALNCLQRVLFKDCLECKYELHSHIVTLKGVGYTAKDLLKKMCRKEKRVTLEQLQNWEKDLNGNLHYNVVLDVGYGTMIRTTKDEFVNDSLVRFDVEEIDKKINELMGDKPHLPLSAFTSFTIYPHCGVAWSKYVIESFCLRFSQKFKLVRAALNSVNAGAIVRMCCEKDYDEILIDAVVTSEIPLTKESVLNFLTSYGYLAKANDSKLEELLKKAKIARLAKENR